MTGAFQFKTDFKDPYGTEVHADDNGVNQLLPNFYGGAYGDGVGGWESPNTTVNRYCEIITESGVRTLVLKLNALGGINISSVDEYGYTLTRNQQAFEQAFLAPLGITRVTSATVTTPNTLHIDYQFYSDEEVSNTDTLLVKIKTINTYNRLVNVARLARAIMNNGRDNDFIVAMIMLAMIRDDDDHKFSAQIFPVPWDFNGPSGSPMATYYGPVVKKDDAAGDTAPHVGFTWPVDIIAFTDSTSGYTWFYQVVRERLLSTLAIDIARETWIQLSAHADPVDAGKSYMGITFDMNDDVAKGVLAVAIIDVLRAGIFSYVDMLRGVQKTTGTADVNIQRGIFPHLSDTDEARDVLVKHPGYADVDPGPATPGALGGTQDTLWLNRWDKS